eukprot:1160553-Pelagomonas_calceolata.AAC.4
MSTKHAVKVHESASLAREMVYHAPPGYSLPALFHTSLHLRTHAHTRVALYHPPSPADKA